MLKNVTHIIERCHEHDFVNAPQDGTGACTSCHDYDTRGDQTGEANTPLAAKVTGAIDNNTPVTCIGCHAAKEQPNTHGDHDDPDTITLATAACTACHDSQGTRNYVNDIHDRRWNNSSYPTLDSNCEVYHINNVPAQHCRITVVAACSCRATVAAFFAKEAWRQGSLLAF